MDPYPLRNIPDDLWHRVKQRAMTDQISVRDVILLGLRRYAADGLAALGDDTLHTLDVQGTTGGKVTTTLKRTAAR
jgi:hypothetical protein